MLSFYGIVELPVEDTTFLGIIVGCFKVISCIGGNSVAVLQHSFFSYVTQQITTWELVMVLGILDDAENA